MLGMGGRGRGKKEHDYGFVVCRMDFPAENVMRMRLVERVSAEERASGTGSVWWEMGRFEAGNRNSTGAHLEEKGMRRASEDFVGP